jgi:DNA repair exonuclease SbcCD nuclease subunit
MNQTGEADVALRLLHTADWHLGKRFSFDEEDAKTLSRARLEVVQKILAHADRRNVDAILCAGDLFDDPRPAPPWWEGLAEILQRGGQPGRPIFLLPGNHDPLTEESVYARDHAFRRALPPFVHVVDRDDFSFELRGGAMLYAAPCRSRSGSHDLARALPCREPGDERLRIGMVHGTTFDLKDHQTNFPIGRGAAVERGLDYLAVGDTHGFRDVEPAAPVPTIYPGAPEPTSFGEEGAGHVAIVLLTRPGRRALVVPEPVAYWRWRTVVARSVEDVVRLRDEGRLEQAVLRLVLDMTLSLRERHRLEAVLEQLKGNDAHSPRVGVLQLDTTGLRLRADVQLEDFPENLPAPVRGAVERLRRRAAEGSGPEREQALLALSHLFKLVERAA